MVFVRMWLAPLAFNLFPMNLTVDVSVDRSGGMFSDLTQRLAAHPWGWHEAVLRGILVQLEASAVRPGRGGRSCRRKGRPEDGVDRQILIGLFSLGEDPIGEVTAALARIANGSYGICQKTGRSIPSSVLRNAPWTRSRPSTSASGCR